MFFNRRSPLAAVTTVCVKYADEMFLLAKRESLGLREALPGKNVKSFNMGIFDSVLAYDVHKAIIRDVLTNVVTRCKTSEKINQ